MKKFKDLKRGDFIYYLDRITDDVPIIGIDKIVSIEKRKDTCRICLEGDREFLVFKDTSYMRYMFSSVSTSKYGDLKDDLIRELSYRKERHDKMSEKYRLALEKAKMNI